MLILHLNPLFLSRPAARLTLLALAAAARPPAAGAADNKNVAADQEDQSNDENDYGGGRKTPGQVAGEVGADSRASIAGGKPHGEAFVERALEGHARHSRCCVGGMIR